MSLALWIAGTATAAGLSGAAIVWTARRSRRANFGSPASTWATLLAFRRSGSVIAARSCFTPESLALLDYVLEPASPPPPMPPELIAHLCREGGEKERIYREELPLLLATVRSNVGKYWLGGTSKKEGGASCGTGSAKPVESGPPAGGRRTLLGLLDHILSGLPADDSSSAPSLKQLDIAEPVLGHEYARAVHDPMFAGFGCLDTFKRCGSFWLLDLAAPLLEAAYAARTHWTPGSVVSGAQG